MRIARREEAEQVTKADDGMAHKGALALFKSRLALFKSLFHPTPPLLYNVAYVNRNMVLKQAFPFNISSWKSVIESR